MGNYFFGLQEPNFSAENTRFTLTRNTAVDESRRKMADRVARSPARLCSGDEKICYYLRFEYDFLVFAFLP